MWALPEWAETNSFIVWFSCEAIAHGAVGKPPIEDFKMIELIYTSLFLAFIFFVTLGGLAFWLGYRVGFDFGENHVATLIRLSDEKSQLTEKNETQLTKKGN